MSANAHRRPVPPTGWQAIRATAAACSSGALRGKRAFGLAALVGLPLLVQAAFLLWGGGRGTAFAIYAHHVGDAYLRVIIPLTLVFLGTAAFGDEWEGGTANYLLGVPVPRGQLVLGRYLAAARRGLLLVLPAIALLYVMCVAPHTGALAHYLPDLAWVLLIITLGMLAYTAVFVFLGLWLRRSIMSSFAYVLVFEGLIGNLPSGFASVSIAFQARNLLWRATGAEPFEPHVLQSMGLQPPSVTTSLVTLAAFVVGFLVLADRVLRRKEFTGSGQQADSAPGS